MVNEWKQEKSNPIDVFKLFWNDDIVDLIVLETNKYHQQKFGTELHVTKEEIYLVFGILILSGYVTVPNRRLFWSTRSDTRNNAVAECGMTRNRFEQIISSLHFVDNATIDTTDRLCKVRPLFDHFS